MFNSFKYNFRLLGDDLLTSFKRIKNVPKDSRETFMKENRKEVLYLYRHMLKHIPPMCDRKLERVHLHEVKRKLIKED